jgi:hypothetical protein
MKHKRAVSTLRIRFARAELLGTFPKLGRPVHGECNVRILLENPVQI